MDPSAETRIRELLEPGEGLLWSGTPCPEDGCTWRYELGWLLFFVYYAVGFVIVYEAWETREPRYEGVGAVSNAALAILIAGVSAFLLFGFYGGILHHLVGDIRLSTTFYGLTDQRAIVETSKCARFVPLESITFIEIERDDRGGGTITCHSDVMERLDFWRSNRFVREQPFKGPLFCNIPDPDHVHTLIAGARTALAGRS
jgi:hypothetical protein